MRKDKVKEKVLSFHQWVWKEEDTGPVINALRDFFRMCYFFYHEVRRNALTLRASALTYITVLSLVPLIAVGTAVLKGLGAGEQAKKTVYQLIQQLDEMTAPTAARKREGLQSPFTRHLKEAVDKIFDYVERTNFATLGVIGVLGLIWAVVSTLTKIEQALNQIWQVKKTRSLGRRILDYTALTVIMPISINLVWGTLAASHIKQVLRAADRFLHFPFFTSAFAVVLPLLILVGTFTVFYRFLPNTHVKSSAALFGGLVGGTGWLLVQLAYIKLQIGIARYNAIYGSFATIPLFLIWVYWGWLAFLCGAQASYAFQNWRGYYPGVDATCAVKLATALDLIIQCYHAFKRGKGVNCWEVALLTGRPESMVQEVAEVLKEGGILKRTDEGEYMPSTPLNIFRPSTVLPAVLGEIPGRTKGESLTKVAIERAGKAIDEKGLMDDV